MTTGESVPDLDHSPLETFEKHFEWGIIRIVVLVNLGTMSLPYRSSLLGGFMCCLPVLPNESAELRGVLPGIQSDEIPDLLRAARGFKPHSPSNARRMVELLHSEIRYSTLNLDRIGMRRVSMPPLGNFVRHAILTLDNYIRKLIDFVYVPMCGKRNGSNTLVLIYSRPKFSSVFRVFPNPSIG